MIVSVGVSCLVWFIAPGGVWVCDCCGCAGSGFWVLGWLILRLLVWVWGLAIYVLEFGAMVFVCFDFRWCRVLYSSCCVGVWVI